MPARVPVRLLMIMLLVAAPLSAQATPEAAAAAFGAAVAAGDFPAAARIMHPAALRQMRDLFALALTNEKLGEARERIFGFHSTAEASSAPDTVIFAAFLKTLLSRQPDYAAALKTARLTPLGHIQQGPDTALVVTRISLDISGSTITQYEVMSFLRDGQVWRGLLKADFTNLAAMLKRLVSPVGG